MKTCRKCGEKLYNHNFTMCDTCEGNSILAVIIRTSDDKRKLEKKEMKAKKQKGY